MIAILLAVAFTGCGRDHVAQKNMRDVGALHLFPAGERTIAELRALPVPDRHVWKTRSPFEHGMVTVEAEVLAFKSEADGDIHVILRDQVGQTMVAELPAPACVKGAHYERNMVRARATFRRLMKEHVRKVRLTGVIFFDKVHGQTGGAPNGIELHPVLQVEALP